MEVRPSHFGQWKCKVLRARTDGRLGSEVLQSKVSLADRFRSARLNNEDTLQGFERGDKDAKVTLEFDLNPREESESNFFWVVQRSYVIPLDRKECPRDAKDCFTSSNVRQKTGQRKTFQVSLEFERLSDEDIENPVVLVREYGERRDGKKYQIYFLPKEDPDSTGALGCVVNGKFVPVDKFYEDDDLCVEAECVSDGEVELKRLRGCKSRDDDDK